MAAMGNGVPIYGNLLVGIIIMMVKHQMLVGYPHAARKM